MQFQEISSQVEWNKFVESHPYGHPLQLWQWGELKRMNGWLPRRFAIVKDGQIVAAAQMLLWAIPKIGKFVAYVPRGPVAEPKSALTKRLLEELAVEAKKAHAVYLHLEPGWLAAKMDANWRAAKQQILLKNTYAIDLNKTEAQLLQAMRGKTRQYIRKAETLQLEIEMASGPDELQDFWRIYQDTAKRAGFGLHSFEYYSRLYDLFGKHNRLYFAKANGQPVAFLWTVYGGPVAFELYGGVTETGGNMKANYLLKWQAFMDAKKNGLLVYDFNGQLNEGVSQFKIGFGPDEVSFAGPYDRVFNPGVYFAWQTVWPMAKPIGRKLLRRQ